MEQLLRGQAVSALERNMPGQAAQPESTAGWGQAAQPEEAASPGDGLYPEEAPCLGDGLHAEEAIYPGTAWDLSGPVLYFPVRHHSPVCSFHLLRAVEAYGPDCILVEGPQNARHLIPVLIHPETKPPVALYYSYQDKTGIVSPEKGTYKCYYPFLSCSPELAALKAAAERKVPADFIDLPYKEILAAAGENRSVRREGEKQTYNDDYLLARSRYVSMLCTRTGMRDFEEFWEKYFEIQGLFMDTPRFVHQMLIYCGLSRLYTPAEELAAEGCLLREQYMAQRIAEASRTYRRILVVTGGFHTYGLGSLLEKTEGGGIRFAGKQVRLHKTEESLQAVYPMAYSMEAADALNGYASGMQSPGFYHQVWRELSAGEEPGNAYRNAVLHFLAAAGRRARGKDESISVDDEICAFSMAEGLASLRGKKCPGLYELRDGALSSFVKGEHSLSTEGPLVILSRLTRGEQAGAVCMEADRPPLLGDFERQCAAFGLKIHFAAEQECVLEIFAKEKHLRLSRFLYQTEFLGCGFARRRKGSDLAGRRDRNRVREIWSYRWSAQVTASLIDSSVFGGTVEEAVRALLAERFAKSRGCREGAVLLVNSFLMGLFDEQERMGERFEKMLAEDGDFFSLSGGFSYLVMLGELTDLYQVRGRMNLDKMTRTCFAKILQLLPSMGAVGEEHQQACMECMRSLYQAAERMPGSELGEELSQALERLLERRPINPAIEGAALGLLYGGGGGSREAASRIFPQDGSGEAPGDEGGTASGRIRAAAAGYIQGTKEMRERSASFLRGLFFTARDFVFAGGEFIRLIDELLGRLSAEEFMSLLPELRLAFSYFTPMETDRIAGKAAGLHGRRAGDILRRQGIGPEAYAYGEGLDSRIRAGLEMQEEKEGL